MSECTFPASFPLSDARTIWRVLRSGDVASQFADLEASAACLMGWHSNYMRAHGPSTGGFNAPSTPTPLPEIEKEVEAAFAGRSASLGVSIDPVVVSLIVELLRYAVEALIRYFFGDTVPPVPTLS